MKWSLKEFNKLQIEEMEKHRWIESEKAGRDLGYSTYLDWISSHADQFRCEQMSDVGKPLS
jgi:hypothetical protein